MNWKRIASGFILSLIFLSIIFFALQGIGYFAYNKNLFLGSVLEVSGIDVDAQSTALDDDSMFFSPRRNWGVPELNLQTEAGVAVESSVSGIDKTLFGKNIYAKLPIASLTKLMTAVISVENYNLSDAIIVSKNAVSLESRGAPLKLGSVMTVGNLLYIMLIESNNQAAYCLSEGMGLSLGPNFGESNPVSSGPKKFVELMNKKANELGMKNTYFSDPTGLSPENVSTADDLIKLAKYILKNHPEIARISRIKEYDLPNYGKLTNTDQLLDKIPEIVAGKTGFTIDAKGCLILVLNNAKKDNYLIYIILGANDRFAEMKKMIDWVNTAYVW